MFPFSAEHVLIRANQCLKRDAWMTLQRMKPADPHKALTSSPSSSFDMNRIGDWVRSSCPALVCDPITFYKWCGQMSKKSRNCCSWKVGIKCFIAVCGSVAVTASVNYNKLTIMTTRKNRFVPISIPFTKSYYLLLGNVFLQYKVWNLMKHQIYGCRNGFSFKNVKVKSTVLDLSAFRHILTWRFWSCVINKLLVIENLNTWLTKRQIFFKSMWQKSGLDFSL